jgi:ABC-type transport system involved in multi-copper enzyme maturation permease subunit
VNRILGALLALWQGFGALADLTTGGSGLQGAFFARLRRWEQAWRFKVVATCVVVALGIGGLVTYGVAVQKARQEIRLIEVESAPESAAAQPTGNAEADAAERARAEMAKRQREAATSTAASINALIKGRLEFTSVAIATGVGVGVALAVVWLGLALTYLSVLLLGAAVVVPLWLSGVSGLREGAKFAAGVLLLTLAFASLLQGLRAVLSGSNPVLSIARNVVSEAVRMRISVVFIVMLIFGLAALPMMLDSGKELRYRVQAFVTYGTGASFWMVALLTVFLACATVAFEQRDKIIWQTMTKPVRAWQYVLGKWLGVSGVAAVLLLVSTSGVLMFTEYLRRLPARGEAAAFIPQNEEVPITIDRLVLETQVLSARASERPLMPAVNEEALKDVMRRTLEDKRKIDPNYQLGSAEQQQIAQDFSKGVLTEFLSVASGTWGPQNDYYVFEGLGEARQRNAPLILRFKVNAGSNLPTSTYRVTFAVAGQQPFVRETRLGQMMTETLPPSAIQTVESPPGSGRMVDVLFLRVFNGDVERGTANVETISFPPDGLEVSFPVEGFQLNFARGVLVMWLKLAFLAMVGVAAATFLSFSVASLVSFGVFIAAEGAVFLRESLESFDVRDTDNTILWWRYPIAWVAEGVSNTFAYYAQLNPLETISEGRLIPWMQVLTAVGILGAVTLVLWAVGSYIFQRRELAIYSGQ